MLLKIKYCTLIAAAIFMAVFLFQKGPLPQEQWYHQFVDTRMMLGIPNAMDVLSNIFFVIVGVLGMNEVGKVMGLDTKKSWWWFFLAILLVAPGSAYYHLNPNDTTLIWDRLPMSMGFMGLYIVLLCEHISLKFEKALYPALILGILSVFTWVMTNDLRIYYWVQFSSFITIPIILLLFKSRYGKKYLYGVTLAFYGLAKWTEIKDKEIFYATHELISGHTLKHILAAVGLLALWWMVKTRKKI